MVNGQGTTLGGGVFHSQSLNELPEIAMKVTRLPKEMSLSEEILILLLKAVALEPRVPV